MGIFDRFQSIFRGINKPEERPSSIEGFNEWMRRLQREREREAREFNRQIQEAFDEEIPDVIPVEDPEGIDYYSVKPAEQLPNVIPAEYADHPFALPMMTGEWVPMSSTNVAQIKYNWDEKTMDVEYQWHRYYTYISVPPDFFLEFCLADSPGGYVWEHIRRPNRYDWDKTIPRSAINPRGGPLPPNSYGEGQR